MGWESGGREEGRRRGRGMIGKGRTEEEESRKEEYSIRYNNSNI